MMARYLQSFPYVAGVELGKKRIALVESSNVDLRVSEDWMPLGFSANEKSTRCRLILVGYGITASELNHNDYYGP